MKPQEQPLTITHNRCNDSPQTMAPESVGKISHPAKTTENFFESNPLIFSSLAKWGWAQHRGCVHASHPAALGSNLTAGKIETNSFFREPAALKFV